MTGVGVGAAHRPRRWHRAAIPLAVATVLLLITAIAYAVEQPDPTDPAFLSPVSDADLGARRLADRVSAAGITLARETRTADALQAARTGAATLLIPAPELLHRDDLRQLNLLPPGTRVVLVDAQATVLRVAAMPVTAGSRRWAAAVRGPTAGPGLCGLAEAATAGKAAVLRQRYGKTPAGSTPHRCYDSSLVVLRWDEIELVLVGASDPFRNDRIGEHGNAALTTGLLTTRPRLIWLDLHQPEPPPAGAPPPAGNPAESPDPTRPDPTGRDGGRDGDRGSRGDPGRDSGDEDDGEDGDGDPSDGSANANSLVEALPPWFWAVLAQLALAAVLVALWRARRLGPPVAEPLPVTVRSAETVRGRGRLYQRAHERGRALEILRSAARPRLAALLGLAPDAPPVAVVAAVAAQSGHPHAQVENVLYGPAPDNDEDLIRMAVELDILRHAVTAPPPGQMEAQQ